MLDELDRLVAASVEREVPVVLTLSGGYSKNAWRAQFLSIKNLLQVYGLAKKASGVESSC